MEYIHGPSLTQAGHGAAIRDLMVRYSNGVPSGNVQEGYYADPSNTQDMEALARMDISEQAEILKDLLAQQKELEKQLEEHKKEAKAKAIELRKAELLELQKSLESATKTSEGGESGGTTGKPNGAK